MSNKINKAGICLNKMSRKHKLKGKSIAALISLHEQTILIP